MPKISALETIQYLTSGSVLPVVDSGETQKVTLQKVVEFVSASLEPTFATDIELLRSASAITSSLNAFASASVLSVATKLSTASFEAYTASIGSINTSSFATTGSNHFTANQTIDGIIYTSQIQNLSGSVYIATPGNNVEIQGSNLVVPNGGISSGFNVSASSLTGSIDYSNLTNVPSLISGANQLIDIGFATTNSLANLTPFLSSSIFNNYTSSNDGKVNSLINKTGSYATTGSNVFKAGQTIGGNLFLSASNPLLYNTGNTNAMLFGFFDGGTIYGPYYQIFGNQYSNTTQRGSAEFVFDSRNGGDNGFNVVELNNSTWVRKFRVNTNGAEVSGSLIVTNGITGSTNWDTIVNKPTLLSGSSQITNLGFVLSSQTSSFITEAETGSFLTSIPNGIVSSSQQITDFGFISSSANIADFTFTSENILNNNITLDATNDITLHTQNGNIVLNPDGNAYIGSANAGNGIVTDGYLSGIIGDTNIINNSTGHTITDNIGYVTYSLNNFTSSYITDSASFDSRIIAATNEQDLSGLVTTSSFNSYTSSNDSKVNSLINVTSSYITSAQTSSFITEAETGSFLTSLPNGVISSSIQITNYGFATTSSVLNIDTSSLVTTSSFNTFTSSYKTDSGSFDSRINAIATSGVPAGTISGSLQITNLGYATTSSVLNVDTSSLVTTASYQIDSASFNSRISAATNEQDLSYLVTTSSFNTYTASISTASLVTAINNLTAATSSYETIGRGILSGSIVTISETTPDLGVGNLWYDSNVGNLYLHYDTNTWVDTSNGVIQSIINDGSVLTTQSFNSWTASYSPTLPNGIVSSSTQITNLGYATTSSVDLTALNNFTSSYSTGSFTGSFTGSIRGNVTGVASQALLVNTQGINTNGDYSLVFCTSGSVGYNQTYVDSTPGVLYNPSTNRLTSPFISGSIQATNGVISSSVQINDLGYATTGSQTINGTQTVNGNLIVTGSITAQTYVISSSQIYVTQSWSSGSTIFGNDLTDTHQFTGSVSVTGSLTVNGSLNLSPSASLGARLWQLSDVNDNASGSITNGYQLAWNSSTSVWEPTAGATAKGSIRLYMATNRSNATGFYFNANTRTASDSASPSSDTAFMVTTNLLNKVTVYLRQDGAGPNSTQIAVYKNADGIAFGSATAIASASLSLTTNTIQTYTFTGLSISAFDSLHVYCDPASTPGTLYAIVTVE
jgi:hypothetical protein